ncbi:hypothetical protein WJX72_003685 [[Myrmecia] bisecta]|uniref:Cytochrome b5 heme-binding domain-containing protein n=1 Tax=[Myrmecia] bisecta TaxID=41462 RepID=A0AAW1PIT5_9CHLO
MLPIYFAVRGKVYDVTKGADFYGPGGAYHVFAGRECSRALGKMSTSEADCTDKLDDLTKRELDILADWEKKFEEKYTVVGKVVPLTELTLTELGAYDGSKPELPIYLSVRGTIFDVSKGKDFYGPDGVYPFAGKECARAFALLSTELEDCNDDLDGLSATEIGQLRDWEAKFFYKYPIIGKLVEKH